VVTSLASVHTALDELQGVLNETTDPQERRGLEAFIDCVTPHLMEGASATFLGKIAATFDTEIINTMDTMDTMEALESLGEHFDIVVE
jgi:hypothetical protein